MMKSYIKELFIIIFYILICVFMVFFTVYSVSGIGQECLIHIQSIDPNLIFVGIPIFITVNIFMYRYIVKNKRRPLIIYSSPMIYCVVILISIYMSKAYYSNFTPNKWKQNQGVRYLMVEDLTKKYTLDGLGEQDVYKLLGKPNIEKSSKKIVNGGVKAYRLGCHGVNRTKYLLLDVDEKGVVKNYKIYKN